MQLPKMRTAPGVVAELRKTDPDTAVSVNLVRELISRGALPVVSAGNKKLVSVEAVCEYLANASPLPQEPVNGIRRIRA